MNALNEHSIILEIQPQHLGVCQLEANSPTPAWLKIEKDKFISITYTANELSIVCDDSLIPQDIKVQRDWRMFKIKGQLDFALVGILKQVISPLADHGISIYAISTFDTDYVLVQSKDFGPCIEVLKQFFVVETA